MELSCDADGVCMVCKIKPHDSLVLLCNSCSSPWHMACLKAPLLAPPVGDWICPDCSLDAAAAPISAAVEGDLVSKIRAIQADGSLTEKQKARKMQELHSGGECCGGSSSAAELDEKWTCLYCLKELDRPVTTNCGHNYCLTCLEKACYKKNQKCCPKCRRPFGGFQPRINSSLVMAIRMAKMGASSSGSAAAASKTPYMLNENRPDKAFVTDRAKKPGLANAASGKMFVNTPSDHFGPILKEHDIENGTGTFVGQLWDCRLDCRQYGVHLPHVSGIAGQSKHGAQSVVLSGGYQDDEDHGEWFLYTGSGGKDLSGNKRTNKDHSSDQVFTKYNQSLRVSCKMGYPVRVVRSEKELRSAYAPKETQDGKTCRYDGIYRIEKCWRKKGLQGFAVCRYLFVRCDNEPAPWTSDTHGDRPRDLPEPDELLVASDLSRRTSSPHWGWKEDEGLWGWLKPPPASKAGGKGSKGQGAKRQRSTLESSLKKREFRCGICKNVLELPVSTPCGHNFCKTCLVDKLKVQDVEKKGSRKSLRVRKVVKLCPSTGCKRDIADFMVDPKVNIDLSEAINSIKKDIEKAAQEEAEEAEEEEEEEDDEEDIEEEELPQEVAEVQHESAEDPQLVVCLPVDSSVERSSEAPLTTDAITETVIVPQERAENEEGLEMSPIEKNKTSLEAQKTQKNRKRKSKSGATGSRKVSKRKTQAKENKTTDGDETPTQSPLKENRKERKESAGKDNQVETKRKRHEREAQGDDDLWDPAVVEIDPLGEKENVVSPRGIVNEGGDDLWDDTTKTPETRRKTRQKQPSNMIVID